MSRALTALAVLLLLAAACINPINAVDDTGGGGDGDGDGDGDETNPPPPPPPTPSPAVYERGSLAPLFELTPRTEYGRIELKGVNMSDADFTVAGNAFISAGQKLQEIAAQIGAERGLGAPIPIFKSIADEQRAVGIPMRGNPSDVVQLDIGGRRKAYVPLGGDLTTPGNEIAVVDLDQGVTLTRVRVGIRPQRVAVHPSGLVFVCNQFSNYISVIDPVTDQLLVGPNGPVEVATEFYCADLAFVPRGRVLDDDEQDLYVANPWRASVLRYGIDVIRDAVSNRPIDVRIVEPVAPSPANQPAAEITGTGKNPFRLTLSEDQRSLYVANSRGGELAIVVTGEDRVLRRVAMNAPTIDVVNIGDSIFVPTTTPHRGLLADDEIDVSPLVESAPALVTGLDGGQHEAHPGALRDGTRRYNFEDVANGLFEIDALLLNASRAIYYTDDNSPEANFVAQQKILAGAVPQAIARNRNGDRIFVAMGGSDLVQEFEIQNGSFEVVPVAGGIFETTERPFDLVIDDDNGQLIVATWGGERLEIFDLQTRQLVRSIGLGYEQPAYPATNIERGEYFYYNADWSNNGRKSCATCHLDELLADGIGYANGATAPTAYHQVRPNYNLMTTDAYFWNGSFINGSYSSLATAAQTRTNCELILFGMVEGVSSDPATRVGDPANRVTDGQDALCRPVGGFAGNLPDNFDEIAAVIASQKLVGNQVIEDITGIPRDEVARIIDAYSVAELRLPPNPLTYLYQQQQLSSDVSSKITQGQQLFTQAGCGICHDPNNDRAPFTDGLEHGSGSDWRRQFVDVYSNDARLTDFGGIPQQMLDAISPSQNDREINIHLDPIDYFVPFCFDTENCLMFEDPLAVRGDTVREAERLELIARINLADPDRGFVPGNVRGRPAVNTPSLRGVWWQANLLRHGHASTLAEAILGPGHSALGAGEKGYAIDALGNFDVHGRTSDLTPAQVEALILYVLSIE